MKLHLYLSAVSIAIGSVTFAQAPEAHVASTNGHSPGPTIFAQAASNPGAATSNRRRTSSRARARAASRIAPGQYVCDYRVVEAVSRGRRQPADRSVVVYQVHILPNGTYAVQGTEQGGGRYSTSNGVIRWLGGPFGDGKYRGQLLGRASASKFILVLGEGRKNGERLTCTRRAA